jgi:hypothetical protein
MNIVGTGTMICARNGGVDQSQPHIVTKWVTLLFFRLWPLETYRAQLAEFSVTGVPMVVGLLTSKSRILERLPWTSNKGHIIRSLIVTWGVIGFVIFSIVREMWVLWFP